MRFIQYDNNTFLVKSRKGEGYHIVDLDDVTCSCEGFQYHQTCAHIQTAMRRFGRAKRTTFSGNFLTWLCGK